MKTSSLAAALYLLTPVVSTQDIVNNLRSASTAAANAVSVRSEYLPERRLGGGSVKDCCSAFPVAGSDCVCLSKNGNLKQRWCSDNDGSYTHENFMYKVGNSYGTLSFIEVLLISCAHILLLFVRLLQNSHITYRRRAVRLQKLMTSAYSNTWIMLLIPSVLLLIQIKAAE